MAQVTIPVPTLEGKKTYLVGLALVLAGLSQVMTDIGSGMLTLDLISVIQHEGVQRILEGLGFIAVRMGIKSIPKDLTKAAKETNA